VTYRHVPIHIYIDMYIVTHPCLTPCGPLRLHLSSCGTISQNSIKLLYTACDMESHFIDSNYWLLIDVRFDGLSTIGMIRKNRNQFKWTLSTEVQACRQRGARAWWQCCAAHLSILYMGVLTRSRRVPNGLKILHTVSADACKRYHNSRRTWANRSRLHRNTLYIILINVSLYTFWVVARTLFCDIKI